jgi:hypothetical protein
VTFCDLCVPCVETCSQQVLIDKAPLPSVSENMQRDVRGDIDRIYASYFPLVPSKDVCFELGRCLMGLKVRSRACDIFVFRWQES